MPSVDLVQTPLSTPILACDRSPALPDPAADSAAAIRAPSAAAETAAERLPDQAGGSDAGPAPRGAPREDLAAAAERKERALLAQLAGFERVVVAFSGGVDSSYLLAMAQQALGARVLAVTADSPSLARSTLTEAEAFCRERDIAHRVLPTDEFAQPEYLANDGRRCYHCKSALLRAMQAVAGIVHVQGPRPALLIGAIADDLGDHRPGMQAAREAGALWPLASLGFSKQEVRLRSRAHGLPTWDRPAEPCLSSRIPYGEPVTIPGLRMVEAAEALLKRAGFPVCRARHHRIGTGPAALCRIEVPQADLPRLVAAAPDLLSGIRALGYASVTVDLAGLVSGGFNRLLSAGAP